MTTETAAARMREAISELKQEQSFAGSPEISASLNSLRTALLWAEQDQRIKAGKTRKPEPEFPAIDMESDQCSKKPTKKRKTP